MVERCPYCLRPFIQTRSGWILPCDCYRHRPRRLFREDGPLMALLGTLAFAVLLVAVVGLMMFAAPS